MTEFIIELSQWLNSHSQWISLTIGALALLESLVMIGLIVPGIALLFAVATLAGSSDTPIYSCLFAAMTGAVCGDLISFFLGRYAHPWALSTSLFRKHPDWIERGQQFFNRYGIYSVVIGRFVGPVRPIVPFVAGMLSMNPKQFVAINFVSAIAWAPVYILPGYWLGSSTQQFIESDVDQYSQYISLALAAIFIFGIVLFLLLTKLIKRTNASDKKHQPFPKSLQLPTAILCLALLATLTAICAGTDLIKPIDQSISDWIFNLRSTTTDPFIIAYTLAGDSLCLALISLPIWVWIWRYQSRHLAYSWAASFFCLALFSQLMKLAIALPRPDLLLNSIGSYAFPSSHTSNSAFFLFALTWWLSQGKPKHLHYLLYSFALLIALGMATTRLYLGAHWPSDVLAGLCMGLGFALLLPNIHRFLFKQQPFSTALKPSSLTKLLCLNSLIIAVYITIKLPYAIAIYQPLITSH